MREQLPCRDPRRVLRKEGFDLTFGLFPDFFGHGLACVYHLEVYLVNVFRQPVAQKTVIGHAVEAGYVVDLYTGDGGLFQFFFSREILRTYDDDLVNAVPCEYVLDTAFGKGDACDERPGAI